MENDAAAGFKDASTRRKAYLIAWCICLALAPVVAFVRSSDFAFFWWILVLMAVAGPAHWELDAANDVLRERYPTEHERWGWRGFWQWYFAGHLKMQWYLLVVSGKHPDPQIRGASLNLRLAFAAIAGMMIVGPIVLTRIPFT